MTWSPQLDTAAFDQYLALRQASVTLCAPLMRDDYQVQSADFVSPPKWHLAHTTWFFETFLLSRYDPSYRSLDPRYAALFNSYYESLGHVPSRPCRGHFSRPTLEEVLAFREHVDNGVKHLIATCRAEDSTEIYDILCLGKNHEQQHQELLLMDIKHLLYMNPLRPRFWEHQAEFTPLPEVERSWLEPEAGLKSVGSTSEGFAFDNELPRHQVYLAPFAIAPRPVTNGEYLEFIIDSGYENVGLWLSDGWTQSQAEHWRAPLYWEYQDDAWQQFTLNGMQQIDPQAAVCHLSYYEAQAFAHWRGCRLPTEFEWEVSASEANLPSRGHVWEWTQSPYVSYPGFKAVGGALGEYNGKFMINQMVLKGGAHFTPKDHVRLTYRNFYPPAMRWQPSGLRLAKDR
jgi:ergothioneine biosynthesis protein EgtB